MPANRNRKIEKAKDFKSAIKRLLKELKPFKVLVILSITLSIFASILSIATPNILSRLTDKISLGIVPNKENLVRINNEISSNFESGNVVDIVIDGVVISTIEQREYLSVIGDISKNAKVNDLYAKIDEFPDSIKSLVEPSMDLSGITRLSVIIGCLYLVSAIFNYIESISMTIVSNKFAKKLRSSMSNKINKLPLKYFDRNRTGDTLSRVTNDIDTVAQSMDSSLSTLVSASTLFFGTLIMMFITNALMAVTAILSSMIGFGFMFFVLSRSQKYFDAKQRELGNLNSHIEEVYSSLNVVKAYNGKELSDKKFDVLNNKLYNANRKSQFLSGLMPPMMHFIGNFGYVAVCIVGALLTMNDVISFGVIIAFISYVRLFTTPLSQIAQSASSLQTIAAAAERVFEFIDESEMKDESNLIGYLNKNNVIGNIEFDNVVFRYDGNDTDTIKNFSAKIKSGSKVAVVGPTGAGKTTIVNLLMKFYDITSGDIKIDGVSIKDLKRENVHDLFTMVLQDTWIYEGTIKDNIIYNNDSVTDKDVEKVCKVVGLDHFIKTFSDGYNTMLVNNESVSAGQRQLLTIARGMLKNAPFLILDEATSNVDTRTEEIVQSAMDKLAEGKTSFIIAHRLSTIKNADLILVMRDGNIVEQGNHKKLMEENGYYAKLYNSQFEL